MAPAKSAGPVLLSTNLSLSLPQNVQPGCPVQGKALYSAVYLQCTCTCIHVYTLSIPSSTHWYFHGQHTNVPTPGCHGNDGSSTHPIISRYDVRKPMKCGTRCSFLENNQHMHTCACYSACGLTTMLVWTCALSSV